MERRGLLFTILSDFVYSAKPFVETTAFSTEKKAPLSAEPFNSWINRKLTFRNQFFVGAMITLQFEQ